MMSSEVLIHAEAAPPAAGLRGLTGQQGIRHGASSVLLHQDVPEAPETRHLHVRHQVRGEDPRGSLRLIQLHETQAVQTERGGREGEWWWGREQGLGVQGRRGGGGGWRKWGGVEASLKLQLL